MRALLRTVLMLTLLGTIGFRAVEFHDHDLRVHDRNCAVCRVLDTPVDAPQPAIGPHLFQAIDPGQHVAPPQQPAPESPLLASHRLRGPPSA